MTTFALHEVVTSRQLVEWPGVSNQPISLIAIFVQFCPGHFVSLRIEYRTVCRALFSRGQLARLLATSEVYEVHLYGLVGSLVRDRVEARTFCLVCHASGSSGSFVVYTM
jgi:hypothetical protein